MLLHVQKSPSNWIRGIGLRCSPLICQITVNLPRHRMKSQREREWKRDGRRRGFCRGPDIHPVSRLSRILLPLPRASRRFGVAVMSESEETQSGQLLIWQPRRKKKKKGREERKWQRHLNNDISVFSTPILDPCSPTCTWRQITCFYELIARTNAVTKMTHWHRSS